MINPIHLVEKLLVAYQTKVDCFFFLLPKNAVGFKSTYA